MKIDSERLTGSTQSHLVEWSGMLVQSAVVEPLSAALPASAEQGFDLRLCSSFRSFDRQLKIWNINSVGCVRSYDDSGARLDLTQMTEWQQIQAVMRWSALPGASRHHWGTDFDIYDAAAVDADYQIQLVPEEVEGSGVFAPFHDWLDSFGVSSGWFLSALCKGLGRYCSGALAYQL